MVTVWVVMTSGGASGSIIIVKWLQDNTSPFNKYTIET